MKRLKRSKNSKKAWAVRSLVYAAFIISAFALIPFSAGDSRAEEAVKAEISEETKDNNYDHFQRLSYQVYAGGINAVKAELDVIYQDNKRYTVELRAKTKGFLGRLVPWNGTFETHGWRGETDQPELHKSTATWKGEDDIKEYHYNRDGSFKELKVIEAGQDKTPKALEDEVVQGTTDALTAALQVMKSLTETQKCEGSSEVFDGKRRFKMTFVHDEIVELTRTKYNVYEGPAAVCTVEVSPVAGKWSSKPRGWLSIQEQGRDKGTLPTVWMGQIDKGGPAVPIKIRVKTDYGTLFMHVVDYKNNDTRLTADVAEEDDEE